MEEMKRVQEPEKKEEKRRGRPKKEERGDEKRKAERKRDFLKVLGESVYVNIHAIAYVIFRKGQADIYVRGRKGEPIVVRNEKEIEHLKKVLEEFSF